MSPFFTMFVGAFCGDCKWGTRVEDPTPADQARVIRQARAHHIATGHNACIERGQTYLSEPWQVQVQPLTPPQPRE